MKKPILCLILANLVALAPIQACGDYISLPNDRSWLALLDSEDTAIADFAKNLRGQGQSGLENALAVGSKVKAHANYPMLVDAIAKQRDAARCGLFWHTDFEEAKAVANEIGRPILSLRLLGNLDEEYSCANSRLFREILYPNPEVKDLLLNNFVLHWESVRPVPVMTIDFGDGRKLKRTITGNSAHYILDHRGRMIDALPGLYTPEKFLAHLQSGLKFFGANNRACTRSYPGALARYHASRLDEQNVAFVASLKAHSLESRFDPASGKTIEMDDLTTEEWALIAEREAELKKAEMAARANELTVGKMVMEAPLITVFTEADPKLAKLESATAIDSVRNEFVLHRRVHQHLADSRNNSRIDYLNKWVYTELFLMPDNDPWMGLNTPDVFTGLRDNGVVSN